MEHDEAHVHDDNNSVLGETLADKLRGRSHAIGWAIAALSGAAVITLFGSLSWEDPLVTATRLLLPVAVMIVYALHGLKSARSLEDEYPSLSIARVSQLADSIYYLGFLWTLWALIDSFVIHDLSVAEAVFRAFGYALVTTASGMFIRLFILQFTYSHREQVGLGEVKIEEDIASFSKHVGNAIKGLKRFEQKVDSAASGFETLASAFAGSIAAFQQEVTVSRNLIESQAQKTAAEGRSVINDQVDKIAVSVNDLKAAVGKASERVVDRASSIEEELTESAKAWIQSLSSGIQVFDESTKSFAHELPQLSREFSDSLRRVVTQVNQLQVPPDLIERSLTTQLNRTIEQLDGSSGNLKDTMDRLSISIDQLCRNLKERDDSLLRRVWRKLGR